MKPNFGLSGGLMFALFVAVSAFATPAPTDLKEVVPEWSRLGELIPAGRHEVSWQFWDRVCIRAELEGGREIAICKDARAGLPKMVDVATEQLHVVELLEAVARLKGLGCEVDTNIFPDASVWTCHTDGGRVEVIMGSTEQDGKYPVRWVYLPN